jgi:hypothetical protein
MGVSRHRAGEESAAANERSLTIQSQDPAARDQTSRRVDSSSVIFYSN